MENNIKIDCFSCTHYDVCRFKKDYEMVSRAVFNTHVQKSESDGRTKSIPLSNFECLGDITVTCKFYERTDIVR